MKNAKKPTAKKQVKVVKTTKSKVFNYKNIKTFADVCKRMKINSAKCLPDVSALPKDMQKAVIAYVKLIIIFKAINNGWKPDWSNNNQGKYYPWYLVLSSGFGFSDSSYFCDFGSTIPSVGSRLCTDTSKKALYIAKQFKQEYSDMFLYEK